MHLHWESGLQQYANRSPNEGRPLHIEHISPVCHKVKYERSSAAKLKKTDMISFQVMD